MYVCNYTLYKMDTSKTDNGLLRDALCDEKYVRTEMWVLYSELQNFYHFVVFLQSLEYCLISYGAVAWHYRIFPDF